MTDLQPSLPGLPPAAFDELGLTAALTPEEALKAFVPLAMATTSLRWLQGDLVVALCEGDESRLHEAWVMLDGAYPDHRPNFGESVAVAFAFPRERRRAGLSWSHHRLAAKSFRDEPTQDLWLSRADEHGWTVDQLEKAITAALAPPPPDELPGVDPSPRPWRLPKTAQTAIASVFAEDPTCVVVLRADGTWTRLEAP